MPKVELEAKALSEVDVGWISLVKRPANQVPFRKMKSEKGPENDVEDSMGINLNGIGNFFGRRKAEDEGGASVVAVAVSKADAEDMAPKLKEMGLDMESPLENGEALIYQQKEVGNPEDVTTFQVNKDMVAMVEGVSKEFMPFSDSTSFNENMDATGFMPGVGVATDALMDTIRNSLMNSDSPSDAKSMIREAINEYRDYVLSMADNLPDVAFKLEDVVAEKGDEAHAVSTETTEKGAEEAQAGEGTEGETASGEDAQKGDGEPGNGTEQGEAEQPSGETAQKGEGTLKEAVPGDMDADVLSAGETQATAKSGSEPDAGEGGEGEPAAKGEEAPAASAGGEGEVASILKELRDTVGDLNETVNTVKNAQDKMGERLDTVEETAQKAQDAVTGTVLPEGDLHRDESLGTQTRKGDEGKGGVWDGALPGLPAG